MKMTGINVTTRDEVLANVVSLEITDTYVGQLAGTMTVGTQHRLPSIEKMMKEARGAAMPCGYYYITPELVDEAELRGLSDREIQTLGNHGSLGKCLKEQHLTAVLHFRHDADFCHILKLHWFQTGKELAEKPLTALIQEAVGELFFEDLYDYCYHEDWLDMF